MGQTYTFDKMVIKRQELYEMKCFVGVTDSDWFACIAQQPGIDEVPSFNLLDYLSNVPLVWKL
jgi:hypothetical protein